MRLTCFGHALFAVGLTGLAILSLQSGEFAYIWQPVPPWVPARAALGYASGTLLLGCSAGLLWPRIAVRAALVLALYGLASILVLHVPDIAAQPTVEVRWFNLGEIMTIVAGAWLLTGKRGDRGARAVLALALLPMGLSHFVYTAATVALVPSWLPGPVGWAYLSGAGHLAAGLGVLFGVVPRLAATLEGLMISIFVLTVHLPGVVGAPHDRDQWSELFVACALGGAAYLVAHSLRGVRWLAIRPGRTTSTP